MSPVGLALRCDRDGNIAEVFQNPPDLRIPIQGGMPFARLATHGSLTKALDFLVKAQTDGAADDWEINIKTAAGALTLCFVGVRLGEQVLIAAAEDSAAAQRLYDALVRRHPTPPRPAWATSPEPIRDSELFDEISRLNNELVTVQRELAKKNAELEQLYCEARTLAITDALTGVYNRRGVVEVGEKEIQRANRFGHPLSAIVFDIDHFKRVNDTHGHLVGDLALQATAKRCLKVLRTIDTVGRYGGEEFAILLPETRLEAACTAAERLRQAVSVPINIDQNSLVVTISLGVAVHHEQAHGLKELLWRADRAMYKAKEAGRNRIHVAEAVVV